MKNKSRKQNKNTEDQLIELFAKFIFNCYLTGRKQKSLKIKICKQKQKRRGLWTRSC